MGRVRDSLADLRGKSIEGVVITKNQNLGPQTQLFLTFTDGTSFEFWIDAADLSMASKVDAEDLQRVIELAKGRQGNRIYVFDGSRSGELK